MDGRDPDTAVALHMPSTTYEDNPDLPKISEVLTDALNKFGFSEEHRKSIANFGVMRQMLHTITKIFKNDGALCFLRMGSSIEGTTADGMGSDMDVLYFEHQFKAYCHVENIEQIIGCVLMRDESTPAGYTTLQVAFNNTIINDESDINLKSHLQCDVLKFEKDSQGHLMLMHFPQSPRADIRHGPADTTTNRAHQRDRDLVKSLSCDDVITEMEEWCQRNRKYNWPTKETRDLFKKLGCFMVAAGHPSSPEKQIEWRISFSLQERHLMRHLNPTQYHCFMLLKLIKKFLIKPGFGDVLTSYHCKTLLFYTIEEHEQDIWRPNNLISCLHTCLMLLHAWVSKKCIPNYFIPKENMFVKMAAALKDKYDDFRLFVENMSCDWGFLFKINFNYLGNVFLFRLNDKHLEIQDIGIRNCLPLSSDVRVSNNHWHCIFEEVEGYIRLIRSRLAYLDAVLTVVMQSSSNTYTRTKHNTFEESMTVLYELLLRQYNPLERRFHPLKSILESFHFNVEEDEKEPRTFAIRAAMAGLNMNRASALAAVYFQKDDPSMFREYEEQLALAMPFYPINSMLVQATVLFKQQRYTDTNVVLHEVEIECKERAMQCECYKQHIMYQFVGASKLPRHTWQRCTFRNPDEVCSLVRPGCIYFKRCQLNLLPRALAFEAYRAILSPTNSRSTFENAWVDSVAVDPIMYMYYLQFLNNEYYNQGRACWALEKMETTLFERLGTDEVDKREIQVYTTLDMYRAWHTPGHFDTWLNILGDSYAKKGWTRLALKCFKYSHKLRPLDNAVGWHVMFLLFSPQS